MKKTIQFEELLETAEPIIKSLTNKTVRKRKMMSFDKDDMANELRFELYKRRNYFKKDFENEYELKGLIRYVLKLKINKIIRYRSAAKRNENLLDYTLDDETSKEFEPSYSPQKQLDLNIDIKKIILTLEPEQIEICIALKDGTVTQVARDKKIKRTNVRTIINNIKQIFIREKLF
ncbi:MAG: hypothetical protein KJ737_00510 [Proteobacteria bacterium]|nr:hypothetical protein [Pseudomonadota bacterium]